MWGKASIKVDTFTIEQRSECMSRIRSKDTKPEKAVRKALFRLGWRYRLHAKDLPGKPDIVNRKRKTAIFVNGCFWHQHEGCKRKTSPKTNTDYWSNKLKRNVERQKKDIELLKLLGWKVIVIWECETNNTGLLVKKIESSLYE